MNKKTVVLVVSVFSVASSAFCMGRKWWFNDYDDDYGVRRIKSNFNPFSKKYTKRLPSNYLYARTLKDHSKESYNDTCAEIRECYDIGNIKRAIIRVADLIYRYAFDQAQADSLADYVVGQVSHTSTVSTAQFEREWLPLFNVISNNRDVHELNKSNSQFSFCDELDEKYGSKIYLPAVRIVSAYVVTRKLIGKEELKNLGSLGDIVLKGLESSGIMVAKRDLKKFEELGQHIKKASVSPKDSAAASLAHYALIGIPLAAVAASIFWLGNKKQADA